MIYTRDLKGTLDLANDQRLAEYDMKRRRILGQCRSSDQGEDDLADATGIAWICIASVALWISVCGAMMVAGGMDNGWIVSVAGITGFVMALTNLARGAL